MNRRHLLLLVLPLAAALWFVVGIVIPGAELMTRIAVSTGAGVLLVGVALWPRRRTLDTFALDADDDQDDALTRDLSPIAPVRSDALDTKGLPGGETDGDRSDEHPPLAADADLHADADAEGVEALPRRADDLSRFFDDAPDHPEAAQGSTPLAPSIFDDLPQADVSATDYQPSYRSLLISLAELDPAASTEVEEGDPSGPAAQPELPRLRPSPMSRTAATVTAAPRHEPASDSNAAASSRNDTRARQQEAPSMTHPTGRALDAVAAISPFGSGTPTGVPSEFRIANQEQERVADLAEAFEADVDQAATTAPTSAGRAHFRTSRDTSADDDEFVQPVLTSRNALGSGGSDSNGPMLTPRKGIPEDLINLTRGPRMFGEEPRRAMDSREDLEDLFKEFLASYRRAGRQAPLIDFPSFERRIRDQQVRLLKEDPRARIEVFIRQEEGRPRICFRKLA